MKGKKCANKTSIIAGEGKSERIFLEYLKNIYYLRGGGHSIKIHRNNQNGHGGGSTVDVAKEILYRCCSRHYDAIFLLLDSDIAGDVGCRELLKSAKKKGRRIGEIPNKSKCLKMLPCFEGFMLKIVDQSVPANSPECKRCFESFFHSSAQKMTEAQYRKFCPKELLEAKRKNFPLLDELITYFE